MSDNEELAELRAEINTLRATVRQLVDREQISDCLHRYTRGLDRLDMDLLGSAYFSDARDRHGPFHGSTAGFLEWAREVMQPWDSSVHLLDLNNIKIDGDEADSECYVLYTQRREDGTAVDFGGGRYLDHLQRRDGEWRIATRNLIIDWSAEAGTTVLPDADKYPARSRDRDDPSYARPFYVQ